MPSSNPATHLPAYLAHSSFQSHFVAQPPFRSSATPSSSSHLTSSSPGDTLAFRSPHSAGAEKAATGLTFSLEGAGDALGRALSMGLAGTLGSPDAAASSTPKATSSLPHPYSSSSSTTTRSPMSGAKEPVFLPTRWSSDDKSPLVTVHDDELTVSFTGVAKSGSHEAGAIRANRKIPPSSGVYYYEVTIVQKLPSGDVGVGFSSLSCTLNRLPGWERDSFGYHSDGKIFGSASSSSSATGSSGGRDYGPQWRGGDVIGCGVDWTKREGFFTRNGIFLGKAFDDLKDSLYPAVGLRTSGEAVKVNFGQEDFRFRIDDFVFERKQAILRSIARVHVTLPSLACSLDSSQAPTSSTSGETSSEERGVLSARQVQRDLVFTYLSHSGYADTARAFVQEQAQDIEATPPDTETISAARQAQTESRLAELDADSQLLDLRKKISQAIMEGQSERYLELIREHFPDVMEKDEEARGASEARAKGKEREVEVVKGLKGVTGAEGDDGVGVAFLLRVRHYVELVLRAARMRRESAQEIKSQGRRSNGAGPGAGSRGVDRKMDKGKGRLVEMEVETDGEDSFMFDAASSVSGSNGFQVPPSPTRQRRSPSFTNGSRYANGHSLHPPPPSSSSSSDSIAPNSDPPILALHEALECGQALNTRYGELSNPRANQILRDAFGLIAYSDPENIVGPSGGVEAGSAGPEHLTRGMKWLVGKEARDELRRRVDEKILSSRGKQVRSPLETIYRRANASVAIAGWVGVGGAALVNPRTWLLE